MSTNDCRITLMFEHFSTFNLENYVTILHLYQAYNLKINIFTQFHRSSHTEMSTTHFPKLSWNTNCATSSKWIEIRCICQQLSMFHISTYNFDFDVHFDLTIIRSWPHRMHFHWNAMFKLTFQNLENINYIDINHV